MAEKKWQAVAVQDFGRFTVEIFKPPKGGKTAKISHRAIGDTWLSRIETIEEMADEEGFAGALEWAREKVASPPVPATIAVPSEAPPTPSELTGILAALQAQIAALTAKPTAKPTSEPVAVASAPLSDAVAKAKARLASRS